MIQLNHILKDSNYKLSLFSQDKINRLEQSINLKVDKKGTGIPYVICLVRGKEIKLTPEEVVRQLYIMVLIQDYYYPTERIKIEEGINHGREVKRADIIIMDKEKNNVPYIIVEVKKPKLKDGKEQLKSYCNWSGAPIGVWTNGEHISYYNRRDPNYFKDIPNIPKASEKLTDILTERWKIAELVKHDKLTQGKKSLKDLILEMEDEVLANAGVDVFEELFQLIFTKLFDELESTRNTSRNLEFRNYGETEAELKDKIQKLFDKAKEKWEGVFGDSAKITLTPSHLAICISSLEGIKLFNSNLDVVDEAFEYLINKSSKGEKGQYFTPRYVIDMCVKMLNPQAHENMIDTAAGSCGFPVHTIFHVWEQQLTAKGLPKSHLFTAEAKLPEQREYVENRVFAIDFDEKAVRVSRCLNLIAGDGQTNVMHLNSLDYERWDDYYNNKDWTEIYGNGWNNLRKLLQKPKAKLVSIEEEKNGKTYIKEKQVYECRDFKFDILMANPPFAGDIKETRILAKYELAKSVLLAKINVENKKNTNPTLGLDLQAEKHTKIIEFDKEPTYPQFLGVSGEQTVKMPDGTYRKVKLQQANNMGRDILFIERNLDFLAEGGRMAVVLPQGRFNNSSDKDLREYIADKCRILAVVGLHGNVFKPHTGTKTSVLFLQKWTDQNGINPRQEDYPIFFATMQEPSKDNSGDKIYVMANYITVKDKNEVVKEYKEDDFYKQYKTLDEVKLYKNKANKKVLDYQEVSQLGLSQEEIELYFEPIIEKKYVLDAHGHLIVKHDLFNHEGLTKDGIAEAFIEFAKKENFSFVQGLGK